MPDMATPSSAKVARSHSRVPSVEPSSTITICLATWGSARQTRASKGSREGRSL